MPGVVVYLTFTLMYGGIITHSFITCKLHLSSLAKSPNQCCQERMIILSCGGGGGGGGGRDDNDDDCDDPKWRW